VKFQFSPAVELAERLAENSQVLHMYFLRDFVGAFTKYQPAFFGFSV